MKPRLSCLLVGACGLAAVLPLAGCESYWFLPFAETGDKAPSTGAFSATDTFTENLIQERTFTNGAAVTTITYRVDDLARTPVLIDFNGDGKIDPVAAYAQRNGGVIQILLSQGLPGVVDFLSLTLDGNGRWTDLADTAVGDLDGDGQLDIVAAAQEGVVYLRHPPWDPNDPEPRTTLLRLWGHEDPSLEYLEGSTEILTNDEILAILTQVLPPTVNLTEYDIELEQGYTNVEIADLNKDGDNDVVASRHFRITLTPKESSNAEPIEIRAGELQIFHNPGGATTGAGWELETVGIHERYLSEYDRQGAAGLLVYDMDGDGDVDLVSAARTDDNVQVAWFQNPASVCPNVDPPFDDEPWKQWRIGSLRDAFAIDIADLTGDGRPDVVVTGPEQMQVMLFEHPTVEFCDRGTRERYEYDWDTYSIVTFESYTPLDVKALDVDNDGALELVVGGSTGAIRYFESPLDARDTWEGFVVLTYDPPGDVGLLGYGDLDGDGDVDLVAVVDSSEDDNNDRITWIRNDLSAVDQLLSP